MSDLPDRICIWEADENDPNSTRGWTVSFPENHLDIYIRASLNTRPAAPVEGLETARREYRWGGDKNWKAYGPIFTMPDMEVRELVTRSQTEAIIAARDAEIERLQKINALVMGDDENKPRYTTKRLKLEIARATEALEAKLAAAEKALEAIEDHAARCFALSTHSTTALAYLKDIQDEARAVLGGKPS